MQVTRMPDDFVFGTASSAYQIEGARNEDGKGDSIWDRFSDRGQLLDRGDVACDHYHRWQEDVRLLADLGVRAYGFSIAWTRVLPEGGRRVNPGGLGFYDRLVDELLAHGITPYPQLYHWDLPQALQDKGGWTKRAIVDAYLRYVDIVTLTLGDRVQHWKTFSEPWVAAFLGHQEGVFAPGLHGWDAALNAGHHMLLSHGRAVPLIRENVRNARVGIALDCRPAEPVSDDAADVAACRHFDGCRNRWFFDPIFGRGYPDDVVASYRDRGRFKGSTLPFVQRGDMEAIAAPLDFLGLDYYTSTEVSAKDDEAEVGTAVPGRSVVPGHSEMGWAITPAAMTKYLCHIHSEYAPAEIHITENGVSFSDEPGPDNVIDDQRRIDYLAAHLGAVRDAIDLGVPVRAYFLWSFLDNLEWIHGFSQRFGLVWVDHATGQRIPKQSYYWYRNLIASQTRAESSAA